VQIDATTIADAVEDHLASQSFSGVIRVRASGEMGYEAAFGLANRADAVPTVISTRFGTASGTKTFTAVAICQLVETGKLSLESRLVDVVDHSFPLIDEGITIEQLLTHTSGAPDYFDEEDLGEDANFGNLFKDLPMYRVRAPADLLPLFQDEPMKFPPGERFSYNNGGYVLLGLVIEALSGLVYSEFVERNVFALADMTDSGFFEMNDLPPRTATGYLSNGHTNIYDVTIRGMPDGGAFVTAPDMEQFWDALIGHRLLGAEMTRTLLSPHIAVHPGTDDLHYGYGMWMVAENGVVSRYAISGGDPGVAFISARFVAEDVELTILGNTETDAWPLYEQLKQLISGA
jgi:CubicO group peptidase (beta-lactamase class C family)